MNQTLSYIFLLAAFWIAYFMLGARFRKCHEFEALIVTLTAMSIVDKEWPQVELGKRFAYLDKFAPHWKIFLYFWRPLTLRAWCEKFPWYDELIDAEFRKNVTLWS